MKKLFVLLLTVLTVLLVCPGAGAAAAEKTAPEPSSLTVRFIDVGEADAALLVCDGEAMLIDGGNVGDSDLLYTCLKDRGISRLKYVFCTHPHEDHVGGLAGALNYATADQAYCSSTEYDTDAFRDFVKYLGAQGRTLTVPSPGDLWTLGGASVQALGPVKGDGNLNNTSLVLRVTHGDVSFLFTGDAEREEEQSLLEAGCALESTVLKVGHHGSDTSTSYPFLRAVMPKYAVISVGTNDFGHPDANVLSRLRDAGAEVFRTDLQGDIVCVSDGKTVTVTPEKTAGTAAEKAVPLVPSGPVSGESPARSLPGNGAPLNQESPSQPAVPVIPAEPAGQQAVSEPERSVPGTVTYVLNINSHKFHYPGCKSVGIMKSQNRKDFYGTREEAVAMGYQPCGNCHP